MPDDHDFFLQNVRHVPELKRDLLSISMFNDIGYCTRVERGMLKILHDEVIIVKWSKTCGLYILEGSNVVVHSLLTSEGFQGKKRLWDLRSRHDDCMKVVSITVRDKDA